MMDGIPMPCAPLPARIKWTYFGMFQETRRASAGIRYTRMCAPLSFISNSKTMSPSRPSSKRIGRSAKRNEDFKRSKLNTFSYLSDFLKWVICGCALVKKVLQKCVK